MMEDLKYEMAALRRKQEEIKRGVEALLAANDNININKFTRLFPITSIESFDEIDNSVANCEADFASLVKI